MQITSGNTARVLTDPQNDFLSPEGVTSETNFRYIAGAVLFTEETVKALAA